MSSVIHFDTYEVDLGARELRKGGLKLQLRDQSFQVLTALLQHPGELVTREQLRQMLWPNDVFVDFDNGLNTAVARLREALCDPADHPRYVETLPRRGYRFIASAAEERSNTELTASKRRLLVLPFSNLTGDPNQEYLGDAITDDVITEIVGLAPEQLAVIARTTAMRYKNTAKDIATIGRELAVDLVVEGSLRRADDRVAVNVQLIQSKDEAHSFAKKFEADLKDLFRLEAEIANSIVGSVPGIETPALTTSKLQPTNDVLAYQLYLQGRHQMLKQTPDAYLRAKQYFDQALGRDPNFALAYYGIGELCWWSGFFGVRKPREAFSAALAATSRALEIDDSLGEAHGLHAKLRHHLDFNWSEVDRELALALRLSPYSSIVRFFYATSSFIPHGRISECISELTYALELDPLSLLLRSWLGVALYLSRDYDRAMKEALRIEALEPTGHFSHIGIGNIHREAGNLEQAIACHRHGLEVSGGSPQLLGWLGLDLGFAGKRTEAQAIFNQLQAIATKTYVSPTSFAWVHVGLGDVDAAFDWLDKAVEERDPNINPIKTFPFLDSLRDDQRYVNLLGKMNLAF